MEVTFVLDTTAPVSSVTVPRMLAENCCAMVLPAHRIANTIKHINLANAFMRFSLFSRGLIVPGAFHSARANRHTSTLLLNCCMHLVVRKNPLRARHDATARHTKSCGKVQIQLRRFNNRKGLAAHSCVRGSLGVVNQAMMDGVERQLQ